MQALWPVQGEVPPSPLSMESGDRIFPLKEPGTTLQSWMAVCDLCGHLGHGTLTAYGCQIPTFARSPLEVAVGTSSDTDPGCAAGKCLLLRFPGQEVAPGPFPVGSHPRQCTWEQASWLHLGSLFAFLLPHERPGNFLDSWKTLVTLTYPLYGVVRFNVG